MTGTGRLHSLKRHRGRFKLRDIKSSLVHLLVRNAQDVQYLHHHFHDDVRHRGAWSNLVWVSRRLKKFSMLKDVDKSILRCADVLSYLTTSRGKLML